MIKRVNFTGRKRIERNRVDIEVYDGKPRTFDAKINLNGTQLLPLAAVFLEATCAGSTMIKRFVFGEVGNIRPPEDRSLKGIEGENVFFTLKVVDRTDWFGFGRILGILEHIRPERAGKQTAAGRRGILPIERAELGQELWRLDFREHDVFLLVNKDIPGLADKARFDPLFYAAVYPEVVRDVLIKAITENVDIEEDNECWPILWLRFGKNLHPAKENPPRPDDSEDDREEWVDAVVRAFCDTHAFKDKYLAVVPTDTGGEP